MKRAAVAVFLLAVGCGKAGEPLPPFIRIPEPVMDLAVHQSGHDVVLTWTNPARNIDGSAATDLARVQIRRNDAPVATVNVTAAAQTQSHSIPLGSSIDGRRTFTVLLETARGKLSKISNAASITPVEVPGPVGMIRALADQRRITLQWEKPREHPELADMYFVRRNEPPDDPEYVSETRYEDNRYQPGRAYTYEITAVRRTEGGAIPGVGSQSITIVANDRTPPQVPTGLDVTVSDTGGFLTWEANTERDLHGYHVFRSERADGDFKPLSEKLQTTNAIFDATYRPGLYYAVAAVDEFGNESAMSQPFRAPL